MANFRMHSPAIRTGKAGVDQMKRDGEGLEQGTPVLWAEGEL